MTDETWGYLLEEIRQVEYLQQFVTGEMWGDLPTEKDSEHLEEYYHHFYALMEKQQVLWTRLKLMGRESLYGILIAIEEVCDALGKPPSMSVEAFHKATREEIKKSLSELTGEDLDNYDGIDVDFRWG